MKSTGVVRVMDTLGRIVIPSEIREIWDLQIDDPVGIFSEDDKIILKKHSVKCAICGNQESLLSFHAEKICENCIDEVKFDGLL